MKLTALATRLAAFFATERYPSEEQGGVFRPADRPVQRLGLALEPVAGLAEWVAAERLDALWLHRPWQLDLATLPPDLGVLAHHLPFDETLTLGCNPHLAAALGLGTLEELGYKQVPDLPPRAIGMLGDAPTLAFGTWLRKLEAVFGGCESFYAGGELDISRVAVVGAMTDALVREAVERGAQLYLTGQFRQPARRVVEETGLSVVATGHRRSEEWGLRALADVIRTRWPELTVAVYPNFLTNSAEMLSA